MQWPRFVDPDTKNKDWFTDCRYKKQRFNDLHNHLRLIDIYRYEDSLSKIQKVKIHWSRCINNDSLIIYKKPRFNDPDTQTKIHWSKYRKQKFIDPNIKDKNSMYKKQRRRLIHPNTTDKDLQIQTYR